jgi:excisionase family DNA binding protein
MKILEIDGTDHLTVNEERQLGDGLRILARIIAKAILRERSLLDRSRRQEPGDSVPNPLQVSRLGKPDESLALSVEETANILGLSRNSVYEAVRTGKIASLRFGKRIIVPRAALNKMLSQSDPRAEA